MTTAAIQKSELRKLTLARRDSLPEIERIEMSIVAGEHALAAPIFNRQHFTPGTIVAGFHPIRSEIDLRPLMFELTKRGARLCLPVVTSNTVIEFRELLRGEPLIKSGFGTIGPGETATVLDPQILLMPLSVFDMRGGRMGYGAGYYDRAIKQLLDKGINPTLLGMAFSAQKAQTVPMEEHDRFLNGVITEQGYFPTPAEKTSGT